jgi:hypothetical protein
MTAVKKKFIAPTLARSSTVDDTQVSSISWSISISADFINVKHQNFYLVTIPFEADSLRSFSLGAPTSNTLSLNPTPTTYARQATVNGITAIVYA